MGFLDKIIQFFEELAGGGLVEPLPREPEPIDEPEYFRKFVAGLVYCGGKKRTAYGLTFEENDIDREQELLDAIESETSKQCSEIRNNTGYSSEGGFDDGSSPQYPEIEVGFE